MWWVFGGKMSKEMQKINGGFCCEIWKMVDFDGNMKRNVKENAKNKNAKNRFKI